MKLEVSIEIAAPTEKVWEILLDKTMNPDKYIPGIEYFEIKEREEGEFIRTIQTEDDDVIELIVKNEEEMSLTSTLVRHGFLKGELIQKVEKTDAGSRLILEQNREITIPELEGLDMRPALEAAAKQVEELAIAS